MRRVTFFVGQTNSNGEALDISVAQFAAFEYLAENFGGFTAIPVVGGWKNPANGSTVVENALRIEVLTDVSERTLENAAKFLRETFKQEEVIYSSDYAEVTKSV